MTEANRYEIKTLRDFNKIPPEKIPDAFVDFASWLGFVRMAEDAASICSPDADVMAEVLTCGFTWIDDGRNDAHITLRSEVAT